MNKFQNRKISKIKFDKLKKFRKTFVITLFLYNYILLVKYQMMYQNTWDKVEVNMYRNFEHLSLIIWYFQLQPYSVYLIYICDGRMPIHLNCTCVLLNYRVESGAVSKV